MWINIECDWHVDSTMSTERKKSSNKHVDSELLTRPSWVNARIAYKQVKKGKTDGNRCALWVRWQLQKYLYSVGSFIHLHCGKVLFVGLLLLSLCCVGLKTAKIETDVEKLWVEEGGRLEQELTYTRNTIGEGSGITNQLLIQTPKSGNNVLTQESLLLHRDALLKASQIKITMYENVWTLRDLCHVADFPSFENPTIDGILGEILPCVIITPLDCFWEGSQVLGPNHAVNYGGFIPLKWTNLNPMEMVEKMKDFNPDAAAMEEVLLRAGITSGYQEKPCLDPMDPDCPASSPNRDSSQPPDVGVQLTGGCHGFATKYMHWHEDLIVGGARKNKTGHIVRAEALQSVVLLMGEANMFEYWKDSLRTYNMDWTLDKAKIILEAWQRKFTQELNDFSNSSMPDNLFAFSMTSLLDLMREFSDISIPRLAIGYVLMLFYACVSLLKWNNAVQSQSGIGILGVLLVALTVAAGLGICSVLGISFNASTTQVIPFLALGLGVDDMFLIAHTYAENAKKDSIAHKEQTAECLKRTGTTVLLTSITNMLAFLVAAIIPIPALRVFSIQAAILILFNLMSVLLVFPAICSLDLIRKKNKRVDVFCCIQSYGDKNIVIELQPQARSQHLHDPPPPPLERPDSPPPSYTPHPAYSPPSYRDLIAQASQEGGPIQTTLAPDEGQFVTRSGSLSSGGPSATNSQVCLTDSESATCKDRLAMAQRECLTTTLTTLATNHYAPFLQRTPVKVFTSIFFGVFLIIGIWGTAQVKEGLDLTDIVPKGTIEYNFLEAQSKYFGFYNIYLVTKEFDYANEQQLLREYYQAFQNVHSIIKQEDGSLPTFWLDAFRNWLLGLQAAFDEGYKNGTFHRTGWYINATNDGILAFILLGQTGNLANSYDTNQVTRARLVSKDGIIYPPAFYNYLTAWVSNDALAYTSSMASIHPQPKSWIFDPYDSDTKVHKAKFITYAQIPFYLSNLSDTEKILNVVLEIREICDRYTAKGLANYPQGVPFTFWEQYIKLRFYLMLALLCILVVTFLVLTLVLMNPWLAAIVVVVLSMVLVELFGFMGLMGLKLSAIPAVILIVAVGISVEFTVHIGVGFVTAIGSRNKRMAVSLEHTFAPVIHGAISTLLGIIMLAGAEFDFIVSYFFYVLSGLVFIGLMNGLVLLPVILSVFGPNSEVRPKDNEDCIPMPSPEPSPRLRIRKGPVRTTRSSRRLYPRIPSDLSLTTITEEPSQYSSHEIIVQPEVIVETSIVSPEGITATTCGGDRCGYSSGADRCGYSSGADRCGYSSGGCGGCGAGFNGTHSNCSSRHSTPPGSVASTPPPSRHVTRVKATATVKVEVHTPLPGTIPEQGHTYKSRRRKAREIESSSSDSDSSSGKS